MICSMTKVTFGEVLKVQRQTRRIKEVMEPHAEGSGTGTFKEILRSINKVKRQPHHHQLQDFTNFVPTARQPRDLAHLQEVITEGQKSTESLWDSKRQFEWVTMKSQTNPRLIENGSFFWSQRGPKVPWYQLVKLGPSQHLEDGAYTLLWEGKEVQSRFSNGVFHVMGESHEMQPVDAIVGEDAEILRQVSRKTRSGWLAVFRLPSQVVYRKV